MAEEVKPDGNTESIASSTRQRKKRKWDQPAESIISASASTQGLMPLNIGVLLAGTTGPCVFPSLIGIYPAMCTSTASAQSSSVFPTAQQNAAAIVQKINQDLVAKGLISPSKIQDELIAREIVINDAEPGVRHRLTKRQTQEEIQSNTGAVVITRGRYKPPDGPIDHEKPLYLHISAGAQLKDTAERIRAVDQAATLVDEMLRQGCQVLGSSSTGQLGTSPMSAVVFVDFEADSSLDLLLRIRGPNDQYIKHIMNETGATVLLKGGACEGSCNEDIPQPLHLLISAEHAKSLEDARRLAEHLLETIRSEVVGPRHPYFPPPVSYNLQQLAASTLEPGNTHSFSVPQQLSAILAGVQTSSVNSASIPSADFNARIGSSKNYSSVPPPKQLLTVDAGSGKIESSRISPPDEADLLSSGSALPSALSVSAASTMFAGHPVLSSACASAPINQLFAQQIHGIYPQASRGSESYPSYSAYNGLYPQASPLQQVALALQRPAFSPSSVQPSFPPPEPSTTSNQGQLEKHERQRRKFQEGPSLRREPLSSQGMQMKANKQVGLPENYAARLMPPPGSILASRPGSMPPPPPVSMRPPKARSATGPLMSNTSAVSSSVASNVNPSTSLKSTPPPTPPVSEVETLGLKLVEYGEDEEEDDSKNELKESDKKGPTPYTNGKPFWAV